MTRVLIVDDERVCRESAEVLLTAAGFVVRAAANGPSAFTIAEDFIPQVLVVDWFLGVPMNGVEVARRLQQQFPSMHTLVVSGMLPREEAAEIAELRRTEMLLKPLSPDLFTEAVRRAAAAALAAEASR